ncbi:MAG TPA: L-serine ammonia-lyase, iron-sulfur-dependent, subunit alpha [Syntrophomonas sp.]|jgi:L-serine dehydratase|nr:L-serine ammonia-lyase, iron-sulfur-dependent, subunit alpha [Syntrophomonas sp.]
MYQFRKGTELLNLCQRYELNIDEIMLRCEIEESGQSRKQIWELMQDNLQVMNDSIIKGLDPDLKSAGGLVGGNASKVQFYMEKDNLCGKTVLKVIAYALAVSECNAAMGKIVAAPTAGASGILPGILVALSEEKGYSQEELIKSLFVAAAVGKIIATNATLSGAEGGCQAECGSAASMAAAAAVFLAGGSPQMSLDAGAIALKGLLGLVCDPVAGLVEVPCSKRNGNTAAIALTSADMALAGIKSFLPFDEVVEAMYRIGKIMVADLRETAAGGCAITPTALRYAEQVITQQND